MAHLGVRLRHRLEALHVPKVEARRVHHHARAHGVPHELRDARTARALRVFGALRASAKLFWVPSGTEAARVGLQKAPKESTHWSSLSQSKSRSWQRFQADSNGILLRRMAQKSEVSTAFSDTLGISATSMQLLALCLWPRRGS